MSAAWTGPLFDHLWQSTWFAAACAVLALALRHHEARLRTMLWSAAIVKFLVPSAVLAAFGDAMNVWSRADVPPGRPTAAFFADALAQPFTLARFETPEASAVSTDAVLTAAVSIWAAGALVLIARWVVRWIRLRAVVRSAEPAGSGRELDIFRRAQQRDPRFAHVSLALTNQPIGPGVAGSVWPVVLWPRGMSDRLSDDEMASVFAHELCHVRRRDNLVSAFCRAVEALFWFHPAVWILGRRLQEERERACDEGVVAATPPHVYAEALVKTCQFHLDAPLVCGAGGTPSTFSGRIARILRSGPSRPGSRWVRSGLAAALVGTLALPVAVAAVMPPELVGLGPNRFMQAPQMLVAWAPRGVSPVAHGDERFVSVSVWPSASRTPGGLQAFGGGRLAGTAVSPDELIRTAYGGPKVLPRYRVVGLPEWAYRERFDLRARAASPFVNEPSGEPRQFVTMLQHLLADEFGLTLHRERRRLPVYALVVAGASLGPRLRASSMDCWRPGEKPVPAIPVHPRLWCHSQFLRNGVTEAASMEWLANVVGARMPQPAIVVDRTGLTGPYDIGFTPPAPGSSLVPALEAQLGLTLEPSEAAIDLLVVDRIERPRAATHVRFGKGETK
jgi:bla regulator protein blaR1